MRSIFLNPVSDYIEGDCGGAKKTDSWRNYLIAKWLTILFWLEGDFMKKTPLTPSLPFFLIDFMKIKEIKNK